MERKTEVTPGYYVPPPAPFAFYPWYTAAWVVRNNRLVWSGTVKTDAPGNIDKAIKQYVKTIVKALERDGVLAGA